MQVLGRVGQQHAGDGDGLEPGPEKLQPEDISVVGYDGIPMASYSVPRLSTVRQDTQRLAERGGGVLLRNIERDPGR